jgi:ankyrin repeat protein
MMHSLIDPQKKAEVLKRIRERKAPLCAALKPESEGIIKKVKGSKAAGRKAKKPISIGIVPALDQDLVHAIYAGDYDKTKELLDKGASPNAINFIGSSALVAAASQESVKFARLLIARGADVNMDLGKKNFGRSTALRIAKWRQNEKLIKFLKKHGAK